MKKLVLSLLFWPFLAFAVNPVVELSAKRLPNENFEQAKARVLGERGRGVVQVQEDSVLNRSVPFIRIDFEKVPVVLTRYELRNMFNKIRDDRFLQMSTQDSFPRRISWLYPDDGCFARAAAAGRHLAEAKFVRPAKVFAFGSLSVDTPYAPKGYVSWWYHVAPIVGYLGDYYVLDPAINPYNPLRVEDWFAMMNKEVYSLNGVVCSEYSYNPSDSCAKASPRSEEKGLETEKVFLRWEWRRMSVLGFDPELVLGETPPWLG